MPALVGGSFPEIRKDAMEKSIAKEPLDPFLQRIYIMRTAISDELQAKKKLLGIHTEDKSIEMGIYILEQKLAVLNGIFNGTVISTAGPEMFGKRVLIRKGFTLATAPKRDGNNLVIIGL